MILAEQRKFVVAQNYRKGKSFIPPKTHFFRIVDPFFECLHAYHNGDRTAPLYHELVNHRYLKGHLYLRYISTATPVQPHHFHKSYAVLDQYRSVF
jgi:hypothetical protein